MKTSALMLGVCTVIVLCSSLAAVGQAQNREKFVISAKAGGVNFVSGRVMVRRTGQSEQLLTDQDNLTSGDTVSTAVGARIEILLNPGSYFRTAESSEIELTDNSLNNLQVKLIRGSAIVEATGTDDTQLAIGIGIDQSRFVIVRRGLYRINVQPGLTELLVEKGRVLINDSQGIMIKGGNKVVFNNNSYFTSKLTKKDRDDFDIWSKQRAETLARANQKLPTRAFNGYLASFNFFDWHFSAANPGLWAFSPFSRCFTFMPFYYGWGSPYGHYYGYYWGGIYDHFPGGRYHGRRINRGPVIVSNPSPRRSSGGSSSGPSKPSSTVIRAPSSSPRQSQPPRGDPVSGGRGTRKP